jgi:hypothetical protein
MLALIVLATVALLCVGSGGAARLVLDASQAAFARTCLGTSVGASMADSDAAFAQLGLTSSGRAWTHGQGSAGPPDTHAFFQRGGLTRWQQCTIEVEPSTQRVTRVALTGGTDFASCTDRRSHPRRFWLCAIGDALAL